MDATANISRDRRPAHGATSLRATLALAWPLILANLTQQLIQATDVLLMGRLGATQLAAATLALNLTFTFNLLLLGLVTASSPMMATALGAALQCGARRPADLPRRPVADRDRACRPTGCCCGTSAT